jgi:AraC-like DNA-binding protein
MATVTSKLLDPSQFGGRGPKGGSETAAVSSATSRIGPLVFLPSLLRELGFDPEVVLADTGFSPAYFTDPDMPIPYRAGGRMLGHCAVATRCEHLGLMLARQAGPDMLGLPGLLLMSAKDVGTGLSELARYMDLHDRGAVLTLQVDGDDALLGYEIVDQAEGADQLHDLAMTMACNLMRTFCGERWTPSEVMLPRRRPADASAWRLGWHAPVRFEAERCGLRFPAHWLALSPPTANPALHQYLQREVDRLQSLLGKGLVDEVRRIVQGTVSSPPCNASRVAALLGMHERTLNRRLHASGTNFRQLRDDVLRGMSRQMLGTTTLRVAEVAVALGYAEASAFIRAFTRWAGQTPDQWRRGGGRTTPSRS